MSESCLLAATSIFNMLDQILTEFVADLNMSEEKSNSSDKIVDQYKLICSLQERSLTVLIPQAEDDILTRLVVGHMVKKCSHTMNDWNLLLFLDRFRIKDIDQCSKQLYVITNVVNCLKSNSKYIHSSLNESSSLVKIQIAMEWIGGGHKTSEN